MVCAVREGADRIRFCLEHCGAAEEKSGIGGSMVRTTKKKAAEAGLAGENAKVAAQSVERVSRGCRGRFQEWGDIKNTVREKEEPETKPNGFSQAMAWMSEPEWDGESSEGLSETLAGSREPEGGAD
jgi:hypothetical protein